MYAFVFFNRLPHFTCFSVLFCDVPRLLYFRGLVGMVKLSAYTRPPALTGIVPLWSAIHAYVLFVVLSFRSCRLISD